jgi:threonine dehydrogenase-like Zn-dependent dehydrogenase
MGVGPVKGSGQAVAVTSAGRAELVEIEDEPGGPGDVAGRTLFSLISPGTELAAYTDQLGTLTALLQQTEGRPYVPGYAAVFRVEEVGADVRHVEVGQLAYCMGSHRSRQCHPADMVLPLPEGLDPAAAPYARLAGVSMSTLTTTTARPPGPVLVLGLGLVGNLAAQAFQAAGYDVVAADPVESRVALARAVGIEDARTELEMPVSPAFAGAPEQATQASPGFALVVECSGHEDAALQGCRLVRPGGEVVLVATPWQQRSAATAHDLLYEVFFRYVHLRSGWEWEVPVKQEAWRAGSMLGNHALALCWLAEGKLDVRSLGAEVDPRDMQDAYQALLLQEGPLTRVLRWEA